MNNLNSSGPLGNIMSRLSGLKNVSRRKVMPGDGVLQNLEDEEMDLEDTAQNLPNFSNFLPPAANVPESDLGGELTPQSYDIRANTNQSPDTQEEPGFFSKIGRALGEYVNPQARAENTDINKSLLNQAQGQAFPQTPPIATEQVDMQEGLPPVTASEQEEIPQNPGIWETIKNEASKPYGAGVTGNIYEKLNESFKGGLTPSIAPETYERMGIKKPESILEHEKEKKQLDQTALDEAEMNPWHVTAYGATDAFANQPELVSQFEEYTGINFDEQQKDMTEKYEKVLSDIQKGFLENDASYDEQESRIKQRILNNESDDNDKFYIGLALLMPLLIGGMFGKEAGLGALGGGAKGITDIYKGRQENIKKDEELLSDIYKQRSVNEAKKGELELEKLKIPEQIRKNLPKDEMSDIKGMKIVKFKDPETGEIVAEGPEILPDLVLDMRYGNTPENRKEIRKEAIELEKEKAALERANEATSDIIKAAMQLKDPGIMSKILAYSLSDEKSESLKKFIRANAPEITVDGRKQNSAVYIDSKIEQMKDAYRRNEGMKAFTQTVSQHIGNMAENPLYSGLKPKDLIDQMLIMRDRGQQFFVDKVSSQGFLKIPIENKFGKLNRELYKGLNTKEEKSQLERDKQLMYGSA